METTLTRRDFTRLAAATGLGIVSASALFGCSSSTMAETGNTTTVDVLVVGAGAGGLGAALRAAEAGKSVVLFEKEGAPGGDTALSAGTIHAAGTSLQQSQGFADDTTEAYIAYMMNPDSPYATDTHPLCTALYDGALAMVEELAADGVAFLPIEDWDIRAHNIEGGGGALIKHLTSKLEQSGVDFRSNTPISSLIVEDGRVVGVQDTKGNAYRSTAVVLATGGFASGPELVTRYLPDFADTRVLAAPGSEGDGLVMAQDIGAGTWHLDEGAHTYFVSTESTTDMSVPPACAPGIIVNIKGDRFHNEESHYDVAGKAGMAQPEQRAYYVFDETIRSNYPIFEDYFAEGIVIEADSLEALTETIGTPNLPQTIAHYNDMMAKGVDEDFGREGLLAPIEGPKYFAMGIEPVVYYTYGGLEIDPAAHVLDENGEPIGGLFACGELCASSELKEGLNYTSGISQGYVFGRIAVETALKELLA